MEASKLLSDQTTNYSVHDQGDSFQMKFSSSVLPILDNLSQLYFPFQFFELIQIFFCVLQIFETSYWTEDGEYWKPTKISKIFHCITFFSTTHSSNKENIILFCIFFSLTFLVFILFIVLILHYYKTRRIYRQIAYTIRIYYTLIGVVIIHPISSLMSHLLVKFIEERMISDMVLLVFVFFCYVLSEVLYYIFQRFINEGIYLHKSLFVTFDSTLLMFFYLWNPFFLFLSHLFKFYPNWSFYILILFHIFLIIFHLCNYIWFPYIINFGNVLSLSISCTLIFNDIFRIFAEFYKFKHEIFIVVTYLVFIVTTIVIYFIVRYIENNIKKSLSYQNSVEPSHEEKFNCFYDLKLNQDIKKAVIYLVIGFTSGSDMFIDFSLIQYCFEIYRDKPKMLSLLVHILAYFKSQKNRFDSILNQIHSLRNVTFYDRFLYYQAHRIKIFRQFTSTNFSTARLNELKNLTDNLEGQIKSFWSIQTANKNSLFFLESKQRKLNNFWDESIELNWLSSSFRELHIRFLIESCTNFQKAIQMENVKEKIDILKKERTDLCFQSLILCFPQYLNRKMAKQDGNVIFNSKSGKNHSSNSSFSSHNEKVSTASSDYDFTQEEQIANNLLTYGRLRLSMQKVLNYSKPTNGRVLLIYTIFLILSSLICLVSIFAVYFNKFNNFNDWEKEAGVLINLRLGYVRSFFCLSVFFGQMTKRFDISPIDCIRMNEPNRLFLELTANFNELALLHMNATTVEFSNLMELLLDLSLQNDDTTYLTSFLFDPIIETSICHDGEIIDHSNWSLEQILNFEIFSVALLAEDSKEKVSNWPKNNSYFCHISTNFFDVQNKILDMHNALTDDLGRSSNKTSKKIVTQMIIFGCTNLILFIVPLPIIFFFYLREINHLIKMILATSDEQKEQAKGNISLKYSSTETIETVLPNSNKSFDIMIVIYLLVVCISFLAFIVFEEFLLYFAKLTSERLKNIGTWSTNFALLRAYLMELIIEIINAVYYVKIENNYISDSILIRQIDEIIDSIDLLIQTILNDRPGDPAAVSVDSTIDRIVLSASCDKDSFIHSFHDVYKCGSLNQVISTVHVFTEKICEEIDRYNGIFRGEIMENIYHITFAHAITDLIDIGDRYTALKEEENKRFKLNSLIFFIGAVIFNIVCLIFMSLIILNFQRVFNISLCLIRRLPPVGLITNSELTNYLLYKKGEEIEIGVTHKIFNNSFDGIICLTMDGVVEIINKSFTNDYGYSTEQLVGQQIGLIFDTDSRIKVENQLKLMKNHESRDYADNVICLTNDGRMIQTYITLFVTKGNENNFILVVRDETVLLEKKKRLEMAKKQSQDLLEQIMPPKVLMMLKEGKSEISFSVPSATVIFVDIVNFSGFSVNLSPQQIMGTLSTLFGAFDVWIQKYPLITKIKLIGDIYMAACGLFDTDEMEPKNHAKQGIDFCLRVLNILDDTNIKLNTYLQIRIGVNTDGPLIAGVLGTENRVFDIIGDTINVASRLEHKAEPGHILMSEKTFVLVNEFGYNITPIGEVFLKGKGDMKAYSI